ncbi:isochorismatase family protein [Acuticoccus mangrovi]|uniref:Isochorismatase family protein n=1 Tax=Acuticoccus mangrovi TaxID=2796142 RepID=A0A934IPH2_9HYPH|nr:isochorismatase family protein [Acuticoccus mangrovi]MBJ3776183.1 isochorismatase family protein [Acuticoccus mangrovi]
MSSSDTDVYARQGFGGALDFVPPAALVVIDFQEGFADPDVFGGGNIAEAMAATLPLLEKARSWGWPIAHTRVVFAEDGSNANRFSDKLPALLRLTPEASITPIVTSLAPRPGELVIDKQLPSAFADTPLRAFLTRQGVRTLVVAGCTTSGCVRATVIDAMNAGLVPVVVEDCVGDRALGPHAANLFDMQQKYADVLSRDALLSRLGDRAAA